MKIGICDDVAEARQQIMDLCRKLGYEDIFLFQSGEELIESPECSSLTLLFLDIEMNGMNGIEVKNILEQSCPFTLIIFYTTHQELMPDAFGRNVISFISKPFSEQSIKHSIEKASFLSRDFYPVKIDDKTAIPCKDILYLHAEQKYTIFYTEDGRSFTSRKSLKDWGKELDELGFCPVSRSAVINLKHYMKIYEKKIILYNNMSIPISRRYMNLLKQKFDTYMFRMLRLR